MGTREESGMSIETIKNWLLTVTCLPKGNIPQKESISHLSLSDGQNSVIRSDSVDVESNTMWEKGMFIDLYT